MKKSSEKLHPILKSIRDAFQKHIPEKGAVYVAVSGGLDSTVLLYALHQLRDSIPQNITVVHINHQLRAEESSTDEQFVEALAKRFGFSYSVKLLHWDSGSAHGKSQNVFRSLRREYFEQLCQKPADRILMAHHLDDQVETFLLRLIRGTGLHGLKCMDVARGNVVRPLLGFSKEQLREYAHQNQIQWREDSSNSTNKYERNWVRNELVPLLEKRRSGFSRRTAGLVSEIQGLEKSQSKLSSKGVFVQSSGEVYVRLSALPPRTREAQLLQLPILSGYSRAQKEAVKNLLRKKSGRLSIEGCKLEISQGVVLITSQNHEPQKNTPKKDLFLKETLTTKLGKWRISSKANPLVDGFEKLSTPSGVTIKKLYQSAGIPLFFRDQIPLLQKNGRVWVLNHESNDHVTFTPSELGSWFFDCARVLP